MPSAALLAFSNCNVGPMRLQAPNDADEFAQILASPVEVGDVAAIGEGEKMVGAGR